MPLAVGDGSLPSRLRAAIEFLTNVVFIVLDLSVSAIALLRVALLFAGRQFALDVRWGWSANCLVARCKSIYTI